MAPGPLRAAVVQEPLPDIPQIAPRPYILTASTFWISTVLPHRRQPTLSKCLAIWSSRSARPGASRPGSAPSARGSSRSACQYSAGKSSAGANPGLGGTFLPTTAAVFPFAPPSRAPERMTDKILLIHVSQMSATNRHIGAHQKQRDRATTSEIANRQECRQ